MTTKNVPWTIDAAIAQFVIPKMDPDANASNGSTLVPFPADSSSDKAEPLGVPTLTGVFSRVLIDTDRGPRMAQDLETGDRVRTGAGHFEEIRHIVRTQYYGADGAEYPSRRPIRISKDALGPDMPSAEMTVAPDQRLVLTTPAIRDLFGSDRARVVAQDLTGLDGIYRVSPEDDMVIELVFDTAETVSLSGLVVTAFEPFEDRLGSLDTDAQAALFADLPKLAHAGGIAGYLPSEIELDLGEAMLVLNWSSTGLEIPDTVATKQTVENEPVTCPETTDGIFRHAPSRHWFGISSLRPTIS